ncbi:substrate-binding domain-containing protein [Streptomyces sp. NBC_00846]|uniref:LamG domain-containing protein n=1 Tax=Streptomyces sp. NBC_00846 TaxID=2975849 RepID=UPI00386EDDFC|nr:substrate-binding domain-containing protein [Streptomyces sp. NBC_00846]
MDVTPASAATRRCPTATVTRRRSPGDGPHHTLGRDPDDHTHHLRREQPELLGVNCLPEGSGRAGLHVQAFDRAGRGSEPTDYQFRVGSGRAPEARWKLTDAAGSRKAAAEAGPAARVGTGATFGAGAPSGTDVTSTVSLDGTGHGFATPDAPVVATDKTFSVGAWVRPAAVDGRRTVVSQDAGQGPAFTLGLRQVDGRPAWSLAVGGTPLTGGLPEVGEWAYVLGRYDAWTGKARLYVNGKAVGDEQSGTPAAGDGDFQIGRARGATGYRDRWQGEIGDVRVYDRVAVAAEVAELGSRKAQLLGHWGLETEPEGVSPETNGGQPLKLGPGASIHRYDDVCDPTDLECDPWDLVLDDEGHLNLDGRSGYAATEKPVVDTGDSFTVSAIVRLADQEPEHPMTALSQGGVHADAFNSAADARQMGGASTCTGPSTRSGPSPVRSPTRRSACCGSGCGQEMNEGGGGTFRECVPTPFTCVPTPSWVIQGGGAACTAGSRPCRGRVHARQRRGGHDRLLSEHPGIDGVFAANGLVAQGVCQVLREHGRRVPHDVVVVGDDSSVAVTPRPSLPPAAARWKRWPGCFRSASTCSGAARRVWRQQSGPRITGVSMGSAGNARSGVRMVEASEGRTVGFRSTLEVDCSCIVDPAHRACGLDHIRECGPDRRAPAPYEQFGAMRR